MERTQIADRFEQNIARIVEDWVDGIRHSASIISSEDLSEGGLRDHVPQVIEEIIALLRSNDAPNVFNTRFTQDYRISELIIEIAILREILFQYLYEAARAQSATPDLDEHYRAATAINKYLDEEMRYGSSIFCESLKNL